MFTLQQQQNSLDHTRGLWKQRNTKPGLSGWHGFGICRSQDSQSLTLLVDPDSDPTPLVAATSDPQQPLPINTLRVHRFRQMRTGNNQAQPNPLQPGNSVFGLDVFENRGCVGTIGAFLRLANPASTDQTWLLSNNHVLVQASRNPAAAEIKGSDDSVLSKNIKLVSLQPSGNLVDAAIAALTNASNPSSVYPGLQVSSNKPVRPVPLSPVQKLGNATGVTCGTFLCICDSVDVLHCNDNGSSEFVNQMLIGSIPAHLPFLDDGDSGSLVVSNGQPAGLLFAKTEKPPQNVVTPSTAGAPFGLASPFDTVLAELSRVIADPGGRSLEMLLAQTGQAIAPALVAAAS